MSASDTLLASLRGRLIVSCQPDAHNRDADPMNAPAIMAALARAAELGGAAGIRADGPSDIAAIRAAVKVPVIGIFKVDLPGYSVRITPRLEDAVRIAAAGADAVAVDATKRPRPEGGTAALFIRQVKEAIQRPVFADIATVEEALEAAKAGADCVMTTLSGYTSESPQLTGPDFNLIRELAWNCPVPVIAEGRIHTPAQAARALNLGAWAVTVGSAITRPRDLTAMFVAGLQTRADSMKA